MASDNKQSTVEISVFSEEDVKTPVRSIQLRKQKSGETIHEENGISDAEFRVPPGEYTVVVQGHSFYEISKDINVAKGINDIPIHISFNDISKSYRLNIKLKDGYNRFQAADSIRITGESCDIHLENRSTATIEVSDTGKYTIQIECNNYSYKSNVHVLKDKQEHLLRVPPE